MPKSLFSLQLRLDLLLSNLTRRVHSSLPCHHSPRVRLPLPCTLANPVAAPRVPQSILRPSTPPVSAPAHTLTSFISFWARIACRTLFATDAPCLLALRRFHRPRCGLVCTSFNAILSRRTPAAPSHSSIGACSSFLFTLLILPPPCSPPSISLYEPRETDPISRHLSRHATRRCRYVVAGSLWPRLATAAPCSMRPCRVLNLTASAARGLLKQH